MRLVIDTNVWLAMLAMADPDLASLHDSLVSGSLQACSNEECEGEFVRVLGYPRGKRTLDEAAQAACAARFRTLVVAPDPGAAHPLMRLPDCRDPDDQKFLELARACGAQALLTRDRALLEIGRRRRRYEGPAVPRAPWQESSTAKSAGRLPFAILTPARFLATS